MFCHMLQRVTLIDGGSGNSNADDIDDNSLRCYYFFFPVADASDMVDV